LSTSRPSLPLRRRLRERLLEGYDRIALAWDRVRENRDLPALLTRIGQQYARIAQRKGIQLEIEVDPALAHDLVGPYAMLGRVLCLLLDRAFAVPGSVRVALQVDVVGDDSDGQLVHITVADTGNALDEHGSHLATAQAMVDALDGVLHRECAADRGTRIIVEITLTLPRVSPRIDIETLRDTLGGTSALREVIAALDRSLSRDLIQLHLLLAQPGTADLQAWLHRVSGALGMAEATDLARMGLHLERRLAEERSPTLDAAIRRFGEDAACVLQVLRNHT
jgi:HPt (histidine-containing phosphotransfer) domain-containing protein